MKNLREEIEEILEELHGCGYALGMGYKSDTTKKDISQATDQILQVFENILPPEEDEAQLCKCDNATIELKMPESLIWCMACNKQHGGKTHNSCLAQIRERIGENE